ncbi:MAG: type secretion system secreted protein VgrG [Desulfovibrionales bacterium]|nr:type secretion system secreted protein VgrG [Desulfovibrionales bacterium]
MLDAQTTRFLFSSKALPEETFSVVRFKGTEGLSQTYHFDILLASSEPAVDLKAVLDSPAVFTIKRKDGNIPFNGYAIEFEQLQQTSKNVYIYRAELVPRFWWLSLTRHNQIFLDKSVSEAIEVVLKDGGLTSNDYRLAMQSRYSQREFMCQYEETHLNFASRWMEWAGMYYFFEQTDNKEVLVVTDSFMAHKAMPEGREMVYSPPSGLEFSHREEVIHHFFCRQRKMPHSVSVKDYNYRAPDVDLKGEAKVSDTGLGNFYYYGDHFQTPQGGQTQARLRAQELKCREQVFHGESTVPFIRPGYLFTLVKHYRDDFNGDYMTTEVTHEGSQAAYLLAGTGLQMDEREKQPYYRNSFSCISSVVQFRPERLHQPPRIHGSINARVDAEGSDTYAEVDEQGRYKVVFPFDVAGRSGGKASAWVRMAQPYAGSNHGMHFPLHKGTEVLLTFIDGNPDRPIIAAAVPNPDNPSVVGTGNKTMAGFKSASGGGLYTEDAKGHERMVLHSGNDRSFIKIGSGSDDETWVKSDWWTSVNAWGKNDFTGEFKKAASMWKNNSSTGGLSYSIWTNVVTGLFNNIPKIGVGIAKSVIGKPQSSKEPPTEPEKPKAPKTLEEQGITDPGDTPPTRQAGESDEDFNNRKDAYSRQKDIYDRNKARYDREKEKYDADVQKYNKDLEEYKQKLDEYNKDPDAWISKAEQEQKTQETIKTALGCASSVLQPLWEMAGDLLIDATIAKGLKKVLQTKSPSADAVSKYNGRYCYSVIASGDEVNVSQVSPMTGKNFGMLMASVGVQSAQAGLDEGTSQTGDGKSTGLAAGVGAGVGAATAAGKGPKMHKWKVELGKDKVPDTQRKGMLFLADQGHIVLHAISGDATFRGGEHTEIFGDKKFTLKSKDIAIGDSMVGVGPLESSKLRTYTSSCVIKGRDGIEISTGRAKTTEIKDLPASRYEGSASDGILINAKESHNITIKQDSSNSTGKVEVESNKQVAIKTKSSTITIEENKIVVDCSGGEVEIKGKAGGLVKLNDSGVEVGHNSKVKLGQGAMNAFTLKDNEMTSDSGNISLKATGTSTINGKSIKLG